LTSTGRLGSKRASSLVLRPRLALGMAPPRSGGVGDAGGRLGRGTPDRTRDGPKGDPDRPKREVVGLQGPPFPVLPPPFLGAEAPFPVAERTSSGAEADPRT
jgi:hypothetical protein